MNNQEAKFILSGYRPGGRDAGDAMFVSALKQAQSDPILREWLARSQKHDAAVASKMAEIRPPAGLRDSILAGVRASGSRRSRWNRTVWLAMAAAAAVVIGVTATLWPNRATARQNDLANFALADTANEEHGGHGVDAGALQSLLSQPTTRLVGGLLLNFGNLKSSGCRTVNFAGKPVLEVCFARGGQIFHFYILRHEDFPELPEQYEPTITQRGGLCCGSWADATNRFYFAVVSAAGTDAIHHLL